MEYCIKCVDCGSNTIISNNYREVIENWNSGLVRLNQDNIKILSEFIIERSFDCVERWQLACYGNNIYAYGRPEEIYSLFGVDKSCRGNKEEIIEKINSIINIQRKCLGVNMRAIERGVEDLVLYEKSIQYRKQVIDGFIKFIDIIRRCDGNGK